MKGWAIAAGFYAIATLVMAAPFMGLDELATASFAGDGRLIVWTIAWTNRAILNGLPLFDANMFFPEPQALAYTEHMMGLGVLGLPLTIAFGNPVLVFSLLWLAAFWANALAAHLLALRFTGRHDAAVAAGLVFGWTFFRMSHAGHLQLQWTAWLPLALWLLERWQARPGWGRLAAAFAVMLLQMLTSWYLAILSALTAAAWVVWLHLVRGATRPSRSAVQLIVALVAGAMVLVPLTGPYLRVLGRSAEAVAAENSADVRAYFLPPEDTWLGQVLEQRAGVDLRWIWGEQTQFLGFAAVLLALVGAVVVITRILESAGPSRREPMVPLFFALWAVAAFGCSLGPRPGSFAPFNALILVPGLSLFRAPARFGLLVALGVAVLAAIGLAWCWERLESRRLARLVPVLTSVLAVTMLLEWRVVTSAGRASAAPIPPIYETLRSLPEGAVMSLPDYRLGSEHYFRGDYLLYSTAHWRPIVNGFGRGEPVDYLRHVETLSTFPSPAAAALARQLGVSYFVVHSDRRGLRDAVETAQRGSDFRLITAIGPDVVFEVVGASTSR
jgi:hypothetical protein